MVRGIGGTLLGLVVSFSPASAVSDTVATDVGTGAFSVVWAHDETVSAATVRVFAESSGATELTSALSVSLASPATALALGLVKVDVRGLAPETCYYFGTETVSVSGTIAFPAAAPYPEVCTAIAGRVLDTPGAPLLNDLISHELVAPQPGTTATGALLLLEAPGLAAHPVSAFAGDLLSADRAIVDLNNLFEVATGTTADVPAGQPLRLTELRGLLCPGLSDHVLVRHGRAPDHEEVAEIGRGLVELESLVRCFFADTLCDDTIDIMDAQRVLNAFDSAPGDCRFNPDLDVVADQVINVLDVQGVLNRFGESAPFAP